MAIEVSRKGVVRFGLYELDLEDARLRKAGIPIRLQQQPCKVLALLVSRSGQVISREEIQRHVWDSTTYVDFEQGVNYCIKQVRIALCDDARKPRYIETLPRRGYRFVAPVEIEQAVEQADGPPTAHSDDAPDPATTGKRRRTAFGVYAVLCAVVLVAVAMFSLGGHFRRPARPSADKIVLAVLPFANMSGDAEQDYLSEGMTEEMIAQLSRLDSRQLAVIGRPSVAKFKNVKTSVEEIGKELNAKYILEGSLRLAAGRIRVTAQLMQVSDSTVLWTGSYDRNLSDILAVQDDVARVIAGSIMTHVEPKPRNRPAGARPPGTDVYRSYLEGRFFLSKRTAESIQKAISYFETAITADARYAPAYAGLADCYTTLGYYGFLPPNDAYPKAKSAAKKALALDDELAEAHIALAGIQRDYDWDWAGAEREFKRGLELDPGSPRAHLWYASYLSTVGQPQKAVVEASQALQLDPLSPLANMTVGLHLHYAREEEKAIVQLQKAIEFDPTFAVGHLSLGRCYEAGKNYLEAISEFEKAVILSERSPVTVAALARAYGLSGRREKAQMLLQELQETSRRRYVSAYDIALVQFALGNIDRGFDSLQSAYGERSGWLVSLNVEPRFDVVRRDHRFINLEARIGIPRIPNSSPFSLN